MHSLRSGIMKTMAYYSWKLFQTICYRCEMICMCAFPFSLFYPNINVHFFLCAQHLPLISPLYFLSPAFSFVTFFSVGGKHENNILFWIHFRNEWLFFFRFLEKYFLFSVFWSFVIVFQSFVIEKGSHENIRKFHEFVYLSVYLRVCTFSSLSFQLSLNVWLSNFVAVIYAVGCKSILFWCESDIGFSGSFAIFMSTKKGEKTHTSRNGYTIEMTIIKCGYELHLQ